MTTYDVPRDRHQDLPPGTTHATVGNAGPAVVPLGLPGVLPGGSAHSGFDPHHPPEAALRGDCVHCGFCLPTCPTYVLWGEEMDSPRGRIHLMNVVAEGGPLDDTTARHWDQCLGCMACVSACPSGVQYDKLIESTRAQVERNHRRPLRERLERAAIFSLFPYPRRLRAARGPLRAYQALGLASLVRHPAVQRLLPRQLATMEGLAPRLGPMPDIADVTPAVGAKRRSVGFLRGCVQGAFFPDVNAATVAVLAAEGCEVHAPRTTGCCGALSGHAGREDEAIRFAKGVIDQLDGLDSVVVNAAGCGSQMKEYGYLLRDEPAPWPERAAAFSERVRDVTELLVELGTVAPRHPLPITAAYHDACHLAHAQGVRAQPRALLAQIPGLDVREIPEGDLCCGSAGVYNLLQPDPASQLGERKARNVLRTEAELLVTANPGCWMQVTTALAGLGHRMPVAHPMQLLAASIDGTSREQLLHQALEGPGTLAPG